MTDALRFGTYHVKEPRVAWGARLIYNEVVVGGRGIVWDRTDAIGPDDERKTFLEYLDRKVDNQPFDGIREAIANGMGPGSDEAFTVYEDDVVMATASPQQSHGYIYLTIVAKERSNG